MSAEASTPTENRNTRLSRIIAAGFGIPTAHKDWNPAALRAQACIALRGLQTENAFEEMRCRNARCPTPCSQIVYMQRRRQKRLRYGESCCCCGGKGWSGHRQQHPTQGLTPKATAAAASALLEAGLDTSRLGGAAEVVTRASMSLARNRRRLRTLGGGPERRER